METSKQMQFLELYRMVMADGIAHPKEMETLYRIGLEKYGLTNEIIGKTISLGGSSTIIPKLLEERIQILYEMALIAWADGRRIGTKFIAPVCFNVWHQRRANRKPHKISFLEGTGKCQRR